MKYRYLIIFIMLSYSVLAQVRNKQYAFYTTYGVKGGLGYSSVYNANLTADKLVEYQSGLSSSLGIKTSLNYISTKTSNTLYGIHFDLTWGRFPIEFTRILANPYFYKKNVSINTLNKTLTFRYASTTKRIFIESGVQFSSYIKINETNNAIDENYEHITANNNYASKFNNYSNLVLGGGVFIKKIVVSFRYTFSLSSLNIDNETPLSDGYFNNSQINSSYESTYSKNAITRHNNFQIMVEYYLPFIKYKRDSRGIKGFSLKPVKTSYYWGDNHPYD